MGTNSILSNLTKETAISQIKLSLGADIDRTRIHLVVEGQDDINVMKQFCETDTVIIESYSGKQGVEEIVRSIPVDDVRVVGIRDKDYRIESSHDRLFFYDNCCLEMMILKFDEIFEKLCFEFYEGQVNCSQLKEFVFKELYKLSMFRKYNEENCLGINFNGIKFVKLVNKDNELELAKLIMKLEEINPDIKKNMGFDSLWKKIEKEPVEKYLDITNGHDFLSYYKVICDNSRANKIGKNEIPVALRIAFGIDQFKQTKLYVELNNYCKKNGLRLWQ